MLQFLDVPATWGRSGAIRRSRQRLVTRAALDVAVRKAHVHDPLESIISISRFDNQQVHVSRRQIRKLLEQSAQTLFQSESSLLLSNSDASPSMKRAPFARLGWMFSRRGPGKSIAYNDLAP